jgi:galactose mutarotase-like enzyme
VLTLEVVSWAGRVRHGSFDFEEQRYQLPLNNPPHDPWRSRHTGRGHPLAVALDEPEHAICVEPQSHPPDAFNLGPAVARPGKPVVATATWSWLGEKG